MSMLRELSFDATKVRFFDERKNRFHRFAVLIAYPSFFNLDTRLCIVRFLAQIVVRESAEHARVSSTEQTASWRASGSRATSSPPR